MAEVLQMEEDPEWLRQREIDRLNPPPDLDLPDNSDLEGFAEVLPYRDQVALWAGRIVRKEAQIESMLQSIHYNLSGGRLGYVVVPSLFGRLLDDVIKMLKAAQLEDETYVPECLAVLVRLRAAHVVRNRIIHDQWVERQIAPGDYVMVNAPKEISGPQSPPELQWNIAGFRQCYEELRLCSVMVSGIFWSIEAYVGDRPEIWRNFLPSNREVIRGKFIQTGENQWIFNDPKFVAQLNEEMRRRGEELRVLFAEDFPGSVADDDV